jgi:hypothetical protein
LLSAAPTPLEGVEAADFKIASGAEG